MRVFYISLCAVLVAALAGLARNPAPPRQPAAAESLEDVLRDWEKAMTELKSFACEIERKSFDKPVDTRDEHRGYFMFLKANNKEDGIRARYKLHKATNPKIYDEYVFTGTDLYEYAPASNEVRVHKIPKGQQAGFSQEKLLSSLFGLGAEHVKAVCTMELDPKATKDGFQYIWIRPKPGRKVEFTQARLALYRSNHLPAQIWYAEANGSDMTWNFSKLQINVPLPERSFHPEVPTGWRLVAVKAAPVVPKRMP